jgi:quercetin dioxygenase-like cupin family protein
VKNIIQPIVFLISDLKLRLNSAVRYYIVLIIILASYQYGNAQTPADKQWQNKVLFKKLLSDTGLINKSVQVVQLQIPPGGADTMPHKHPCELVGYITEGEIETKMEGTPAQKYKVGDVFYEYPGQVHEHIKNVNTDVPAKLILFYVFTTGTKLYMPFSQDPKMNH